MRRIFVGSKCCSHICNLLKIVSKKIIQLKQNCSFILILFAVKNLLILFLRLESGSWVVTLNLLSSTLKGQVRFIFIQSITHKLKKMTWLLYLLKLNSSTEDLLITSNQSVQMKVISVLMKNVSPQGGERLLQHVSLIQSTKCVCILL